MGLTADCFPARDQINPFDSPTCQWAEVKYFHALLNLAAGRTRLPVVDRPILAYQSDEVFDGATLLKGPPFGEQSGLVLNGLAAGILVGLSTGDDSLTILRSLQLYPRTFDFGLGHKAIDRRVDDKELAIQLHHLLDRVQSDNSPQISATFPDLLAEIAKLAGLPIDRETFVANSLLGQEFMLEAVR